MPRAHSRSFSAALPSICRRSLRSFPPQSDLTERVPDPAGGAAVEPPRRWSSTSCHGRRRHLLPHDPLPRLRPQARLPHATRTLSRHASLPRRLSRADGARAAVADPVAAAEPVDEEKEKEEETEAAEDEEDTLLDRAQPDLTGPFAHVQFVNGPMPNLPKVDVSLDPVKELSRVISERKN
ncbi:uncharacterized protein [Aegilops tauschii subsp. strangulata]|uniref:uncharacterized protein isoform X1 n=1 Tax=Aegilops tauschii subsp. strangulata TaxID=200361 RepID=UPI003CC84D1D